MQNVRIEGNTVGSATVYFEDDSIGGVVDRVALTKVQLKVFFSALSVLSMTGWLVDSNDNVVKSVSLSVSEDDVNRSRRAAESKTDQRDENGNYL